MFVQPRGKRATDFPVIQDPKTEFLKPKIDRGNPKEDTNFRDRSDHIDPRRVK